MFFMGSASAAKDSICTHCATSHQSPAPPFVPGAIFPVKISKESLLFTPALLGTPDGCYFPSVDVVIPVKYIKFYFSRNSDPWEVKLGLRWKLLYSGNTADAKSSSKPGFLPCSTSGSNLPADLSPAQQQENNRQVQQCWKQLQ